MLSVKASLQCDEVKSDKNGSKKKADSLAHPAEATINKCNSSNLTLYKTTLLNTYLTNQPFKTTQYDKMNKMKEIRLRQHYIFEYA